MTRPYDLNTAVTAAATKFDWIGLEHDMEGRCQCGWTEHELWGAEGADTDGSRPTYEPSTNPCPACKDAVRPFVEAALEAIGALNEGVDR